MARHVVEQGRTTIRHACSLVAVIEIDYHYQRRLSGENAEIVDWLVRLTFNQKNWGFGLCYLYLRNIKGFA